MSISAETERDLSNDADPVPKTTGAGETRLNEIYPEMEGITMSGYY